MPHNQNLARLTALSRQTSLPDAGIYEQWHYEEESKSSPDSREPPSHVIRSYLIGLIIAPIAFVSLTVIGYICEESNDTIGFPMKIVGLTLLGVYFFMTGTLAVIATREFYKGKGAVYWATYEFSGSKWFHVCAIAFMMSMLGFALVVAAFILALVEWLKQILGLFWKKAVMIVRRREKMQTTAYESLVYVKKTLAL